MPPESTGPQPLRGNFGPSVKIVLLTRKAGTTNVPRRGGLRTRNLSHAFHLVSFTLDASTTQDDRKAFADRFHAASPTWSFLGGDPTAVEQALTGFGLTITKTPVVAEMSKREKLVLVDQAG